MELSELDDYLHQYTPGEIKHLTRLMESNSFHSIEEVVENISTIEQPSVTIDFTTSVQAERYGDNLSSYYHELPIAVIKHGRFVRVAEHSHPYIEITYIFSGQIKQTIEGKEIILKQGDLCILDTNTSHSIGPSNSEDIMINIAMSKEYFDTAFFSKISDNRIISNFLLEALFVKQKKSNFLLFETAANPAIKEVITRICCEFFEPKICSNSLLDSFSIWLFTELLRLYEQSKNKMNENTKGKNFDLGAILSYIENNFATVTLQKLSDEFFFNPEYLSKKLKRTLGYSFKELVIQERLKRASQLLRNTKIPVTEICSITGFSNVQFFYAKFSEEYKMSPANYRKSN